MIKEWRTELLGKQIVVKNGTNYDLSYSVQTEAKLYLDGVCVDTNSSKYLFLTGPAMRAKIMIGKDSYTVEIYMKSGLLKVKAKILIDGNKVAGDNF